MNTADRIDAAYGEGYDAGYAEGLEDGKQMAQAVDGEELRGRVVEYIEQAILDWLVNKNHRRSLDTPDLSNYTNTIDLTGGILP